MSNQSGFSLIETLLIVFLIGVVLSISVFSASCVMSNIDFYDSKETGEEISTTVENYYSKRGEYPIGINAGSINKNTKDALKELIPSSDITSLESNGSIYEFDSTKFRVGGKVNSDTLSDYLLVYSDDVNLSKYNGTVIKKYKVENCSDEEWTATLGKHKNIKISSGLKYEIKDDYVNKPNSDLYCKLNPEEEYCICKNDPNNQICIE